MRKHVLNIFLIAIAFLATAGAILTGSYFNSGLVMEIGQPSEILVRAPRDMEDVAQTERNRDAALSLAYGLEETFTADPQVWVTVSHNLSLRRAELEEIRAAYQQEHADYLTAVDEWEVALAMHENHIYEVNQAWQQRRNDALAEGHQPPPQPIIPDPPERPEFESAASEMFAAMPFSYNEDQQTFILNMEDEIFEALWAATESVAETVQLNTVIRHEGDMTAVWAIENALPAFLLPSVAHNLAEFIIRLSLNPNAIPDEALNSQRFEETAARFEVAVIPEGRLIVDEGQIVTEEIFEILNRAGLLAPESVFDNLYPLLGVLFVIAVLFMVCVMYLHAYRGGITSNSKEATLLFTLYMLTLALVWTLSEQSFPFLPILVFPMLVSILIDRRLAAVFTFVLVIIGFFVVDGDMTYLLFYSASGMLFCMFSQYTNERGKSIWVGLLISAIMFALAVAVMFIADGEINFTDDVLITAGFAAASGILTVFLCMGSLPLWETFFGVVTPVKLLDLTNPQNLLLKRLTIEAPGTYHHSLIVANLAETAAYDIGANAPAARVGGYYHDVGKLKFPHYFAENLDGENPHDHLDPVNSSNIIMSHVSFGLTLASEHRLPQFVRDIIREHHGTTVLQYFYSKARELGEECEEKDFRYPYTIPQTRESACVMLADSVEAAVRSMIPKIQSVDEVERAIRFIVKGKLNDGQLAESQLSIKDVTIIEQSFFRVLKGMYHERIAYPTRKREGVKEEMAKEEEAE